MEKIYLDDIYKNADRAFLSETKSSANIDDAVRLAANMGYKEIIVDREEMGLIVQVYLAGAPNAPGNGKIYRAWKLDKFMGIKLFLKKYERPISQ